MKVTKGDLEITKNVLTKMLSKFSGDNIIYNKLTDVLVLLEWEVEDFYK